jgi:hypothetical protein
MLAPMGGGARDMLTLSIHLPISTVGSRIATLMKRFDVISILAARGHG